MDENNENNNAEAGSSSGSTSTKTEAEEAKTEEGENIRTSPAPSLISSSSGSLPEMNASTFDDIRRLLNERRSSARNNSNSGNGSGDEDSESIADYMNSSGSNAEWYNNSCNSSSSSSDSEKEAKVVRPTPKVMFKPKPKHNWFIVKELLLRESGFNRDPSAFTQHFYGSLHAVQRLELMYKLEEHHGCVNALNFNSSGTKLVSGSDDRCAVIWDWATGKKICKYNTGHTGNVFQCKFLPMTGDSHIVSCSRDGQIRIAYRDSSGEFSTTSRLAQHGKACHKLTILPQTPHVVLSAGEDALILQTDIRDEQPDKLVNVKEGKRKISLYSIHNNPMNENEICVSGDDFYVRLYDRRFIRFDGNANMKFKPKKFTKHYSVYVTCAMFNYNGTEIIGSYNDQDIYLFDTKHPEADFIHRYEGHRNSETVKGVNFFGPKSEYIISGSDCGHIYVWDKNTEAIVQWMRGDEDGVINCIEPHPHIPVLATSGLDSDVKIWIPSCENEPSLAGLEKTVTENISNRESRIGPQGHSYLDATLSSWWRQMRTLRTLQRNGDNTDRPPIFVSLETLGLESFLDFESSTDSSSSSSSY